MTFHKEVFLAIGGNIPPRKKYITECLSILEARFPTDFACSNLYLTEPFLKKVQPYYYNCCVRFLADIAPKELLRITSSIEEKLGRERDGTKWQSRTIDIDILLVGELVVRSEALTIPHYDLVNRDFFLLPLLELQSGLIHPLTGRSLVEHFDKIPEEKRTCPFKLFVPGSA